MLFHETILEHFKSLIGHDGMTVHDPAVFSAGIANYCIRVVLIALKDQKRHFNWPKRRNLPCSRVSVILALDPSFLRHTLHVGRQRLLCVVLEINGNFKLGWKVS